MIAATVSHFSIARRKGGGADDVDFIASGDSRQDIRSCYRQLRALGMDPFAARGLVVRLLRAGKFCQLRQEVTA